MPYVDKINENDIDYDIQDSKAARSVDGTTASHVEEANQIYTTTGVAQTDYFIYRTTAGDASINTGPASLVKIIGNTVQTGHTDEVLIASGSFADTSTTVSLDGATFKTQINTGGIYVFNYDGADWKLNDAVVTLTTYGLTVTGTVADGDTVTVEYTPLVVGTLATTNPTSFIATGYNQYDATAGYAHVIGDNQYRISGTYTSLGFTTTVGGATTTVTVTDGKFTPTEDGYIYVTGASGDILIALVWSGSRDSDPYEAYETSTLTIPTTDKNGNSLPNATYGIPSVHGVADELSLADKQYLQRIGHYTYSSANLATVQAMGVDYWYDTSDIFYVLPDLVVYDLADTVASDYTANDFGTEEFIGTTVPVGASLYYGNNLVDKLRNLADIQTIGTGLTLTDGELKAAGGGGSSSGVITLTTDDYNYPENNPTSVALWLLDPGMYAKTDASVAVKITTTATLGTSDVAIVGKQTSIGTSIMVLSASFPTNGGWQLGTAFIVSSTTGLELSGWGLNIPADRVDKNWTKVPLAASQGKALNDKITPSSGSTAPTTATVGILGKIYIDTLTDNAYMCTKVSSGTYTWKQITS